MEYSKLSNEHKKSENGRVVVEKADGTRRVIPGKHNCATSWRLTGLEIGDDSGKALRNSIQNVAPEKTTQSAPQKSQKWPWERTRRAETCWAGKRDTLQLLASTDMPAIVR